VKRHRCDECNLKTYRSTCRQLIVFHPSVSNVESELGIFAAIYTSTYGHIASYVCLSWTLLHPFSGFDRQFGLGILLFNPSLPNKAFSLTACLRIDHYRSYNLGYFVPDIHCFESCLGCLSTGGLGGTLLRSQDTNSPYPCRLFPAQGVSETQAYIPGVRSDDGSTTLRLLSS
jgi:hypothetical protein